MTLLNPISEDLMSVFYMMMLGDLEKQCYKLIPSGISKAEAFNAEYRLRKLIQVFKSFIGNPSFFVHDMCPIPYIKGMYRGYKRNVSNEFNIERLPEILSSKDYQRWLDVENTWFEFSSLAFLSETP